MNTTNAKKKVSFLSLALGSLVVTSLSTGSAEASWSAPRCSTQCSKLIIGNSDTKLNECAKNCDNTKMIDLLAPNYYKLNPTNLTHFLDALKYQQSIKQKEHTNIESDLKTETGKKKPSNSKIKDLNKKQDKLISEINTLGEQIEKISAHHKIVQGSGSGTSSNEETKAPDRPTTSLPEEKKAPERPTRGPRPSRPTSELPSSGEETKAPDRPKSGPRPSRPTTPLPKAPERPTQPLPEEKKAPERPKSGPHMSEPIDISKPPSDMPPLPPSDMPPTPEDIHEPEVKKTSNIPTAPKMGENPRAILKAEIEAQNPGKKTHEINALVKQHLETQHPGKSAAEINQALKEHYEAQHPGKSHAEILEAVKAGGGQGLPESPTVTPSKAMDEPSSQEEKRKSMTGSKPGGGTLTEALGGLGDNPMARLKKFDPEAEAKRKAAAEEKLKSSGKIEQSGNMMNDLQKALAKRRGDLSGSGHDEPETDEDWDTHQ